MTQYLHIMNVAVEPAIERAKLRAYQYKGHGYPCSLQQSVQIIHHPARQHHSSVPAKKTRTCCKLGQEVSVSRQVALGPST